MALNNINTISGLTSTAVGNVKNNKADNVLSSLKNARSHDDVVKASKEFESMFVSQLMNMMFDTVPVDENFGGGFAEETYKSLLVDEYGKNVAAKGGLGIAEKLQQSVLGFENVGTDAQKILRSSDNAAAAYTKLYNNIK